MLSDEHNDTKTNDTNIDDSTRKQLYRVIRLGIWPAGWSAGRNSYHCWTFSPPRGNTGSSVSSRTFYWRTLGPLTLRMKHTWVASFARAKPTVCSAWEYYSGLSISHQHQFDVTVLQRTNLTPDCRRSLANDHVKPGQFCGGDSLQMIFTDIISKIATLDDNPKTKNHRKTKTLASLNCTKSSQLHFHDQLGRVSFGCKLVKGNLDIGHCVFCIGHGEWRHINGSHRCKGCHDLSSFHFELIDSDNRWILYEVNNLQNVMKRDGEVLLYKHVKAPLPTFHERGCRLQWVFKQCLMQLTYATVLNEDPTSSKS